ncbi:Protein LATERAL ROOT PRIMORDIUM 1 [Quillaja saponaria]|uniref:Protein LATERAL ROOT PRIMORDIUM 1 n=1 Tax=Quillaja saponaria TaxID=32244 RepID=A0AAD7PS80_QUISA|nr:Protein LATERAL ROOT PRIMORDIUM 1 [Quillaja saponaria]
MGMVGLRDLFVVAPASSFHHQHHEQIMSDLHSINNSNPATALGVGVSPLLTTAGLDNNQNIPGNRNRSGGSGIQLWPDQQSQQLGHYFKKPGSLEHNSISGNLIQTSGGGGSSGTMTCEDCGNQAKKDCSHRRCRTCCKSRGFDDCTTHLKSTWVPAARRRERQQMAATAIAGSTAGSTSGTKKPRLISSQTTTTSHTSTSNTTPARSFDTSSSHQDVSFKESLPGQVRAPAVFKCVRVTAMEEGDDEYAYQAVVKIGGHVFRGFLYDQGVVDPTHVYSASGGGLLGGSTFGIQ